MTDLNLPWSVKEFSGQAAYIVVDKDNIFVMDVPKDLGLDVAKRICTAMNTSDLTTAYKATIREATGWAQQLYAAGRRVADLLDGADAVDWALGPEMPKVWADFKEVLAGAKPRDWVPKSGLSDAAHEVYWDTVMPSRWMEDNIYHLRQDHLHALKTVLAALGYSMELEFRANESPRVRQAEPETVAGD